MNENITRQVRRPAWLWLLLSLGVIAIDQVTKWLCVAFLKGYQSVPLIPNFLHLTYVENRGAAFGSFTEHRWVFMVFSTVAIVGVSIYLLKFCENDRLLRAALALVIGGGIGNMIDRILLGYVIDFIDFCGIWSYVFNGADSAVCIGAGMLVLYCILSFVNETKQEKARKLAAAAQDESSDGDDQ